MDALDTVDIMDTSRYYSIAQRASIASRKQKFKS